VKSRISSSPIPSKSDVADIDALFANGGLVRSSRAASRRTVRIARPDRVAADEISPAAPKTRIAANGVALIQVPAWSELSWLWHGFSTRIGGRSRAYCAEDAPGELNLGFTPADDREVVLQNRALLTEAVTGDPATPLVLVRQFHSNLVAIARSRDLGQQPRKADGVITAEPGLLLAIQTADCIPVLVADRKQRVVGAFHAGWRGTVSRIVESGVGRMRLEFGSRPKDLIAAIGPGVGACCYAVGDEVRSEFESQFAYARKLFREVHDSDPVKTKYPMLFLTQRAPGRSPVGSSLHLDLIEANRRQLLDAGVKPKAIHFVGGCTSSHPNLFFSHRASRGHAGRMMSVIGVRPGAGRKRQSDAD
jgi:polyphenol oxidase